MKLLPAWLALAATLLPATALADDREAAKQAYDRGAAAFDRGAYAEAAVEFAHADELGPNPVALESALKAATLADDPVLGMGLVDRAEGRAPNERVAAAVRKAREKFQSRAGKLLVRCREGDACTAKIGGEPIAPGTRRWVRAGDQTVEIEVAGASTSHVVHVEGGASVEWQPPAPARPPVVLPPPTAAAPTASPSPAPAPTAPPQPAAPADKSGLSPTWFFVGVGATALLLAGATISGVDTLDKHSDWEKGDDDKKSPGQDAQTRTNILLAVTGAAAIATAVVGIVLVDWKPRSASAQVTARIGPAGGSLTVRY